jgi:multidrug efflux system membrane fusion protein
MRRINTSWALTVVIIVGLGAWLATGRFAGGAGETRASLPARQAPADPGDIAAVRVIQSVADDQPDLMRMLGVTEAARRVDLRVEVDGRIVEVPVERGRLVRQGEVVVKLATEDRQARLQEARAWLRQRQIEHDAAKQLHERGIRSETQFAEAAARLDGARALVKRMEIELANTVLNAPFAGALERRPVELGSFVKIGDTVATIVDLDPIRVVGQIAERDVSRIRRGMAAQARLPDGTVLNGQVSFVGVASDPRTRTFRIEAEMANPERRVVEGLTAELALVAGTAQAHRISPALLTLSDDGVVGVKAIENERVVFHRVAILASTPEGAVIVAGPPARAMLIAVGQEFVGVGQRVRAVPLTAEARPPR